MKQILAASQLESPTKCLVHLFSAGRILTNMWLKMQIIIYDLEMLSLDNMLGPYIISYSCY